MSQEEEEVAEGAFAAEWEAMPVHQRRRARPPRPRDDTDGKWQYFRLVCSPNPARGDEWEWTAEEVAARASLELGREVPLAAVGSTLTKLQNGDGLLHQRHDGYLPRTAERTTTRRLRLYLPSPAGRALASQIGLPQPDRPGPPTAHGRLPSELVLRVIAALPPPARARAACVCRAWRELCATPALWTEVHCDGLTRNHALAAVARCGASLRVLHAGADVLRCDDLARLLSGGACPALEELTTATATGDRLEGAVDFDAATGHAILAACPALRTLNCRLGWGDGDVAQDGAALQQVCDFLRHPAVRCETLMLGDFDDAAESDALAAALADALRAQAACLTRLTTDMAQPWLDASLAAALPALGALSSLYLRRGLPAVVAAAVAAAPALERLHADVPRFAEGALAALAASLSAPSSAVRSLVITPYHDDTPPPFIPPPDAAVLRLGAAVARQLVPLRSLYFETHVDDGTGERRPLITGGGRAIGHFVTALQRGLADLRIGPVDAAAAERLVQAAARARPTSSLILSLALLNSKAASAAAYAARALLLSSYDDIVRKPYSMDRIALVLDDARLTSCASRDLGATLGDFASVRAGPRANCVHLCAQITEASSAGPVLAAFARAFVDNARGGSILRLELKIFGPWSDTGAEAWEEALNAVSATISENSFRFGYEYGLRLLWSEPGAGRCLLCTTAVGRRLISAAANLCAATAHWARPYSAAVRCAWCLSCKLRQPVPSASDHHAMDI